MQAQIVLRKITAATVTSSTCVRSPETMVTRAPMPSRLLFTPTVLISTELFALPPSLRSNCGTPSRLLMMTSTSPSLSMSPKAAPRPVCFSANGPKFGAYFGERSVTVVVVHEIALPVGR